MRAETLIRCLAAFAVLAIGVGGAFFWVTAPRGLPEARLAALPTGDPDHGEAIFWAGGCASCHAEKGAKDDARLDLGGGQVLKTGFGDFVVPNISTDSTTGIGDWSAADFGDAMLRGIAPHGSHYYPAFPYGSFINLTDGDVADLWAFLQSLPPVSHQTEPTDLAFPFNIRRGLGLWKLAFLRAGPVVALDTTNPLLARGQYLVEGPGHCGQCHTPRNLAGGLDTSRWLAGAPAAEGDGEVPNITQGEGGLGDWSQADIAYYLETGFTPDYDSVGGTMVEVQQNMAMLTDEDRQAIAAYLMAVPKHASAN